MARIILVGLVTILFIFVGVEIYLGHERFYRFVAGNIFGDGNDEVAKHYKGLGIFYMCFGLFVLSILWWGPKLQELLN